MRKYNLKVENAYYEGVIIGLHVSISAIDKLIVRDDNYLQNCKLWELRDHLYKELDCFNKDLKTTRQKLEDK